MTWLVEKIYMRRQGTDLFVYISLVAKTLTIKLTLLLAASQNWNLFQLDAKNEFLNVDLKEKLCNESFFATSHPRYKWDESYSQAPQDHLRVATNIKILTIKIFSHHFGFFPNLTKNTRHFLKELDKIWLSYSSLINFGNIIMYVISYVEIEMVKTLISTKFKLKDPRELERTP